MRCPLCKADNSQGPTCRRCKADLSLLWAAEEHRTALLAFARHRLARLDGAAADDENPVDRLKAHIERRQIVEAITAALHLRADADAAQLLAVARLLSRDFAGAWRAYLAATAPAAGDGEGTAI